MAMANPANRRILARLWAGLKSQWLATVLVIPIGFLIANAVIANQQAREARIQSVNVDRISKVQESGKALDLALASYFQSIAELGLAERELQMPNGYENIEVPDAHMAVVEAREQARVALAEHGSDVQSLRGTLDPDAVMNYMAALAAINDTIENNADINRTGENITALSDLVMARNAMVDEAMKVVG